MKKRTGDPWMSPDDYGKSLAGFGINLLVPEVKPSADFATLVLQAKVIYVDLDIAVLKKDNLEWMLHADHTYSDHPMRGVIDGLEARGGGVELRLHNTDPDAAEARARANDYIVLDGSMDKPHGLREVFLLDPAGYVWVIDRPLID